jgi:hypothetical protein
MASCTIVPLALFPKNCAFFTATSNSATNTPTSSSASDALSPTSGAAASSTSEIEFDAKHDPMIRAARKSFVCRVLDSDLKAGIELAAILELDRNEVLVEHIQILYGYGGECDQRAHDLLASVTDKTILCMCTELKLLGQSLKATALSLSRSLSLSLALSLSLSLSLSL